MTTPLAELSDALDFLRDLGRDGVRPKEARARFQRLRERCATTNIDLVWEEEAFDGAIHYDALLSLPGEGTVSLGFAPDRAVPWPMRGVHRWSEADLLRVNGTTLKMDQAIACLDFIWDESRIVDRLVNVCLMQEALEREPIEFTDDDLQAAVDGFRRAHKLYTAEETLRWLRRHGMTHDQLEEYVAGEAVVAKLRERITAGRVEAHFEAHRSEFDQARIARIAFADAAGAQAVYEQLQNGEIDFAGAAERSFVELDDGDAAQAAGTFAVVRRGELSAELAAAIFAASPGDVLPPVATDTAFTVVRVLCTTPAGLDASTRSAIQQHLFAAWLDKLRESATIEWFWSNASRTAMR